MAAAEKKAKADEVKAGAATAEAEKVKALKVAAEKIRRTGDGGKGES